jgi:hypothetical protein
MTGDECREAESKFFKDIGKANKYNIPRLIFIFGSKVFFIFSPSPDLGRSHCETIGLSKSSKLHPETGCRGIDCSTHV